MTLHRISAVGLSAWELNFLQATVGVASGIDIGRWIFEQDWMQADVVFVDAGSHEGRAWQARIPTAGDTARLPIPVVLRDRGTDEAPAIERTVSRPIAYAELVSLLRGLEAELRDHGAIKAKPPQTAAPADPLPLQPDPTSVNVLPPAEPASADGSSAVPTDDSPATDVSSFVPATDPSTVPDPARPEASDLEIALARKGRRAARFFDDTRFLGLVHQAIRSGQATVISHPRMSPVTVYPAERRYAASADPCERPETFRAPALEFSCRSLAGSSAEDLRSRTAVWSLARLLFCAALQGSEGRLRADAEPDDLLEFVDTADFTAMPLSAEHHTIVKLLAAAPGTLQHLVAQGAAGLDAIIDLVNALEVIGCLRRRRVADVAARHLAAPSTPRHGPGKALRRLQAILQSVLPGGS